MKLTDDVKNHIALTLQRKGKTKAELVRAVGMSPSWATNLFQPFKDGGLKELREEQVRRIEEFLGEPLRPESEEGEKVLPCRTGRRDCRQRRGTVSSLGRPSICPQFGV